MLGFVPSALVSDAGETVHTFKKKKKKVFYAVADLHRSTVVSHVAYLDTLTEVRKVVFRRV